MIALDSSVLIEIFFDGPRAEDAENALRDASSVGPIAVSDVVFAEICTQGDSEIARRSLKDIGARFVATNEVAAIRAGEMLKRYKLNGGSRARIIADFLVGAHALMQCNGLITFDGGFHRDYFKGLKVIVPGER
jgi:predicted nucleic acid-binding protein